MEERLEKALEFANYRQTLNNQLQKLRILSENELMFAKNGGTFTINRELINYLNYLNINNEDEAILIDDKFSPILIKDIPEFLKEITKLYKDVTSAYYREYQHIRKLRNVKSIIDIKDTE